MSSLRAIGTIIMICFSLVIQKLLPSSLRQSAFISSKEMLPSIYFPIPQKRVMNGPKTYERKLTSPIMVPQDDLIWPNFLQIVNLSYICVQLLCYGNRTVTRYVLNTMWYTQVDMFTSILMGEDIISCFSQFTIQYFGFCCSTHTVIHVP